MMELLMRQTGRLISTEQFMEHIWGYDSEAEINGQPPAGGGTVRRAEAARRSRMDTVEISEEGRAASARLQGQQTEAAAEAEETERYERRICLSTRTPS